MGRPGESRVLSLAVLYSTTCREVHAADLGQDTWHALPCVYVPGYPGMEPAALTSSYRIFAASV